jgi:hypothetical protein
LQYREHWYEEIHLIAFNALFRIEKLPTDQTKDKETVGGNRGYLFV